MIDLAHSGFLGLLAVLFVLGLVAIVGYLFWRQYRRWCVACGGGRGRDPTRAAKGG